jgi:copper(I)-binding protein
MQKTLLIFFLSVAASLASAQVTVTDVWVRATVQGQKATGAFMNLTAQKSTRLVGVKTEAASVAEIHEMKMENDVMRMKRVPFIDLPAGQTVALKPGGFHVMLMGLKEPLPADSHVQLTLLFEDANGVKSQQDLHVMTTPKAPGGAAPAGGDHAHQH